MVERILTVAGRIVPILEGRELVCSRLGREEDVYRAMLEQFCQGVTARLRSILRPVSGPDSPSSKMEDELRNVVNTASQLGALRLKGCLNELAQAVDNSDQQAVSLLLQKAEREASLAIGALHHGQ